MQFRAKLGDGFIHEGALGGHGLGQYSITATAEIIAEDALENIEFTAKFYNADDEQIDSEKTYSYGLPSETVWDITFHYIHQFGNFFEDVDHISIGISVS